jgi:hypothetical protein
VKTISKPLAGQFEKYVMGHPVLRNKVISLAQVCGTCIRKSGENRDITDLEMQKNSFYFDKDYSPFTAEKYFLIALLLLQFIHRLDVRITRGAEGKTGRAFVGDMSEERAVQLASKVASEGFLYSVSCR